MVAHKTKDQLHSTLGSLLNLGTNTAMLSILSKVTILAVGTGLLSSVGAGPLDDCVAVRSGYLSAGTDAALSFTLNAENQVAYTGNGISDGLLVEYQACASLAPANPDNTDAPGRFYVPAKGQCIKVVNQEDETGLYFTGLADCNTTPPFRFNLRTSEGGNDFYFGGYSDEEGTVLQGGCGLLGFDAGVDGLPLTSGDSQISIVCDGRKAFQVVQV